MRLFSCPQFVVLILAVWYQHAWAFSWGSQAKRSALGDYGDEAAYGPSLGMEKESRLPVIYAVALRELQELETQPLCHRIAARLLVNNCQLLDGKDDATLLTDSGREVRDFVDSYAASLAICDLERGSFSLPSGCSKFHETVLAKLPAPEKARLHVSTQDIDSCLSGLAKSDSAWNTWISYRHKALRFCEAARADNEKAHSVRLYQRLTEILSKLTHGVEAELDQYLQSLNDKIQHASNNLDYLGPRLDLFRDGLDKLEHKLSEAVLPVANDAASSIQGGLRDATTLQQLMSVLLEAVLESNQAISKSHDHALEVMQRRTDQEASNVAVVLAAAVASTTALQDRIEASRIRAFELASRQKHLEHGMDRLLGLADRITASYEGHSEMMKETQSRTEDVLDTLIKASMSANMVRDSIRSRSRWASWWPYIVCPTASLMMGSYGLPPSAVRNLGLVALGELTGLVVSFAQHLPHDIWQLGEDDGYFGLRTDIKAGVKTDTNGFVSILPPAVHSRNETVRV